MTNDQRELQLSNDWIARLTIQVPDQLDPQAWVPVHPARLPRVLYEAFSKKARDLPKPSSDETM